MDQWNIHQLNIERQKDLDKCQSTGKRNMKARIIRLTVCLYCRTTTLKDLTQGQGKDRHYYCPDCKAHKWKAKWYTKQEWEDWINKEVD